MARAQGDQYLAVAVSDCAGVEHTELTVAFVSPQGLPHPMKDHYVVCCRFAFECNMLLENRVKELEKRFGPGKNRRSCIGTILKRSLLAQTLAIFRCVSGSIVAQ